MTARLFSLVICVSLLSACSLLTTTPMPPSRSGDVFTGTTSTAALTPTSSEILFSGNMQSQSGVTLLAPLTTQTGTSSVVAAQTGSVTLSGVTDCFESICFDAKYPVVTSGSMRYQEITTSDDDDGETFRITHFLDKPVASETKSFLFWSQQMVVARLPSRALVRTDHAGGCGGSMYSTMITGALSDDIPRSFTLGNLTYELVLKEGEPYTTRFTALDGGQATSSWHYDDDYYSYYSWQTKVAVAMPVLSLATDISAALWSRIDFTARSWTKREPEVVSQTQLIAFAEYPGIFFPYRAKDLSVPMTTRRLRGSEIVDSKGAITSTVLTKTLYDELFNGSFVLQLSDASDSDFTPVAFTGITMPLFRATLVKDDLYSIVLDPRYKAVSMAELCKPVVYVYDEDSSENSLRIHAPSAAEFTRLIPAFTDSNRNVWKFTANSESQISVADTKYDYLYYSLRTKQYPWNLHGWIVHGSDIAAFFADKLPKIGLTPREEKDFRDYWESEFDPEKDYFVSFKYTADLEQLIPLEFARKPQSMNRILLEAYPVENYDSKYLYRVGESDPRDASLLESFTRSSAYDVFEWGGVVQNDDDITIR